MTTGDTANRPSTCPGCGNGSDGDHELLSQHRVAAGVVRYARCPCGRLQVRLRPHLGAERILNTGAHAHPSETHAA
ncbi:hypothetical protein J4H86_19420 [Spiractinospora alimapuensis]|uniref:hypothetical protein n=1 Tax=Spiractinospora alimapuensis TaxID=2820884 RepID=UPI001F416603|nr:hypothetical protein [Spiractinospora alimapuensis]QVQ51000.1 hypothetical protein J4H86_19420 [Spiractinospora alimapuensis]